MVRENLAMAAEAPRLQRLFDEADPLVLSIKCASLAVLAFGTSSCAGIGISICWFRASAAPLDRSFLNPDMTNLSTSPNLIMSLPARAGAQEMARPKCQRTMPGRAARSAGTR